MTTSMKVFPQPEAGYTLDDYQVLTNFKMSVGDQGHEDSFN